MCAIARSVGPHSRRILLNNAVKYSPAGSSINVSLTRENEHALISVRDDGNGIATEMLPRIFDAFYVTDDCAVVSGKSS